MYCCAPFACRLLFCTPCSGFGVGLYLQLLDEGLAPRALGHPHHNPILARQDPHCGAAGRAALSRINRLGRLQSAGRRGLQLAEEPQQGDGHGTGGKTQRTKVCLASAHGLTPVDAAAQSGDRPLCLSCSPSSGCCSATFSLPRLLRRGRRGGKPATGEWGTARDISKMGNLNSCIALLSFVLLCTFLQCFAHF